MFLRNSVCLVTFVTILLQYLVSCEDIKCSKFVSGQSECLEAVGKTAAYTLLRLKRNEARDICLDKNPAWSGCHAQSIKSELCLEQLGNLTHTEDSALSLAKANWMQSHDYCFNKSHNVDPLFVLFGASVIAPGANAVGTQSSKVFGRLKRSQLANATANEDNVEPVPLQTPSNNNLTVAQLAGFNGILNNPCNDFENCLAEQRLELGKSSELLELSKRVFEETQKCTTDNQVPYECATSTTELAECVTAAAYTYQSQVIGTLLRCIRS